MTAERAFLKNLPCVKPITSTRPECAYYGTSIRSFGAIVMGQVNPIGRTAAAKGRFSGAPPHPRGFLGEPTLSDLLRDPIAEALMAADHVELRDLNILLATARCHLHSPGTHPAIL